MRIAPESARKLRQSSGQTWGSHYLQIEQVDPAQL